MLKPSLYIQHPSALALKIRCLPIYSDTSDCLPLGLICMSEQPYDSGVLLSLHQPTEQPGMSIRATVTWCQPKGAGYQLGLGFCSEDELYQARMFEQLCHIQLYRRDAIAQGRRLSQEEAAREWIDKYAAQFPTDGL